MGWKSIKEHYRIEHNVQVNEKDEICIGSGYIHDIIKISKDGTVIKMYKNRNYSDGWGTNEDLKRYQEEILSDTNLLKELVLKEDNFNKSIKVFTYKAGEIIEKHCEKVGYPNCTHDGEMMYENTFTTDYKKAVKWCREDAEAWVKYTKENLENKKHELAKCENRLQKANEALKKAKQL